MLELKIWRCLHGYQSTLENYLCKKSKW